jgi:HlyD family secretion protein
MNIQTLPTQAEIEAVLGMDARSRRKTWVKRVVWLAILAAVIAGAVWWFVQSQGQTAAITYQTAPVQRETLVVKVQASGNVEPTTQVDVSSERSGVIRSVNVKNNSIVKKGDVLAELDADRLNAELSRVKATLAAAEAKLADAQATLKERQVAFQRAERLSKQGISSGQDLDTARAAQARAEAGVMAAEADIEVVKAELVMQETDITKMRILSPVDGIVLKRAAEPGQTVASSLQAPVLFTLAEDLARMQLEADVDEADIGAVKTGQKASFTVDAYPGQTFPAVIDTIEYSPNITENVVTYTAILTVDNSELLLRPGMTATAQIVTQETPDALAVPNAALRYQPPKAPSSQGFSITSVFMPRMPRFERSSNGTADGERTIYVLENGAPKPVTVKTGVSDGKLTEVVSGDLKAGDEVITSSRQAAK